MFNIYINDIFRLGEQTELCGWADDTSPHACDKSLESFILRLNAGKMPLQWKWDMIDNERIWERKGKKLLGIKAQRKDRMSKYLQKP